LNVTIDAFNFVNVDFWAASFVATALVSWAVTLVFFSQSSEFSTETVSFFAHWWRSTFWSGFTFAVDDLFAAHVWIGVSVNWDQMSWATFWVEWRATFSFCLVDGFVFTAVVSLTFVRGLDNVTDVDFGTVFK
jgi:succinate dehydrogenase hydrophobic anchor subunit